MEAERLLRQEAEGDLEAFRLIHEAAALMTAVDAFYLCRVQRSPNWLHFVYNAENGVLDRPDPYPFGQGPTSQAASSGQPRVITEMHDHVTVPFVQFGIEALDTHSQIHWPMWVSVEPEALPDWIISVQAYPSGAYGPDDLAAVEWLALRATDILRRREQKSQGETQAALGEAIAAQNQAISDVQRFNAILDHLRWQFGDVQGLQPALENIQVELAVWASTSPGPPSGESDGLSALSDREIEVLSLASLGLSTKKMAESLALSEHTVKRHLDNIYGKTQFKKRADIVAASRLIQQAKITRFGH